ncbi:MAG: hypothetical protein IAG10_00050 [Planctomycetaceae bacterium]|nr:hypothetical protein [Planctomycetaceae bacterium]
MMRSFRLFAQRWLSTSLAALLLLASSVIAAEPAVVVSVKSYSELLTDSQYLGNALRQPVIGLALPGFLAQVTGGKGLKGLETAKPIGAYLTVSSEGQPKDFVVFVPVASEQQFSETLEALLSAPTTTGMTRQYQPKNGGRPIFAKVLPKHFMFAQNAEALTDTADPDKLVKSTADITIEIDLTKIADNLKEGFLTQIEAQTATAELRKPSETEAQRFGREAGQKLSLEAVRRLAMDGERLSLGLNVDAKAKNMSLDLGFTAKPGTALAQACASYAKTESPFANIVSAQTIGSFLISSPLSDTVQATLLQMLANGERAQKEKNQNLPADKLENATRALRNTTDTIRKSIQRGRWDQALAVNSAGAGKIQVLLAVKAANARELAQLFEDVARNESAIQFDIAKVGSTRIHSIQLPPDVEREKHLGNGPMFLAFSDESLLFAHGTDSLDALKAALEGKASKTPRAPISLRVGLSKLLPLIPNVTSQVLEHTKSAFAAGNDEIALEIASQPQGATLRLEIQEGILQLIGLAVQSRTVAPGR